MTSGTLLQRYKLHLKKQRLETRRSRLKVQGLKPGGFKLWVNWIQVVQPHLAELHHAAVLADA
jgi:hypothetical protein